jgi:CheY-like chemotaxis protein
VNPCSPDHTTTILIVEDSAIGRRIAGAIVDKLGHRYDTVENGKEAIEAVMRFDYHLVLMDCQMPEMDGFEATASIRALQAGSNRTPIIALTATVDEEVRTECMRAGMDDVMIKPLKPKALDEMLSRFLEMPARDPIKTECDS